MKKVIFFILLLFIKVDIFAQTLLLDSGHMPYPEDKKGALGIRGIYEVDYNDKFVAELKPKIENIGWKVILSRTPNESLGLHDRAEKANNLKADLFLSIHHDSAYPHYLEKMQSYNSNGEKTYEFQRLTENEDIAGYSIFISHKNPKAKLSYCFANLLGEKISNLGRKPNLIYHQDKDTKRLLLHKEHGVYHFDNLVVLKATKIPAVLLEIGVIVSEQDMENWIEDDTNRAKVEDAVVKALSEWKTKCN